MVNYSLITFPGYIKYVSLVVLTVQNAALGLSMRYARTRKDVEMFSPAAGIYILNNSMSFVFKCHTICSCYLLPSHNNIFFLLNIKNAKVCNNGCIDVFYSFTHKLLKGSG